MAIIPNEKIEEIIKRADIVSIISSYIQTQKKGRNYWAVCPFHIDNNPSMSISPEKKIYKCFSCGAVGNVLDFVKNYTHSDFLTALKTVANVSGIEFEELANHKQKSKYSLEEELIFKINEEAMNFYMVILSSNEGQEALQYLLTRGLSKTEILKWEIGFASKNLKLHQMLLEKGFTIEQLNLAGLVSIKNGEVYDYFFNRVIFPIKNEDEKVIGFSARTLGAEKPKYINTRETLVFKKSQLAFNISRALKVANLKKSLIVLEGFMDVISLNRIGIENAVAIMGTSLSEFHLKLFKTLNGEVKIFLDGDQPGVEATMKILKKLILNQIPTSVIDNLTDQDPDELIQNGQREKVELMVNNSVSPTSYAITKLAQFTNLNNAQEVSNYFNTVFELIILLNNPVHQEKSLGVLSKQTNLSLETIQTSFANYKAKNFPKVDQQHFSEARRVVPPTATPQILRQKKSSANQPLKNYEFSQRDILHSLITSRENLELIEQNLGYIPNPELFVVLQELIRRYKQDAYHENNWEELLAVLKVSPFDYQDPKWKIDQQELFVTKTKSKNLDDAFLLLKEYKLAKQEKNFTEKLKAETNPEVKKSWLQAKEKTRLEIIKLRKKRGNK